jgi:hypothetical protein
MNPLLLAAVAWAGLALATILLMSLVDDEGPVPSGHRDSRHATRSGWPARG